MYILAGDIGGTNTRLILTENIGGEKIILSEKDYLSYEFSGVIEVIKTFISEFNITVSIGAVCMAVAGPVRSGEASITNLPWRISEDELRQLLKTENVCLINDFSAVSYGISQLKETDFLTIQNGESQTEILDAVVVGAGTGLGASHLIWKYDHYVALSSEAGHAGFAPETEQQVELLKYLQRSHTHVSIEQLLSGGGFKTIYNFLRKTSGIYESNEVREAMDDADPAKIITEYALLESDLLCQKTLDLFIDIYGSATANIVLHYYPVSTVYIAGGIAPKIKAKLNNQRFITAFVNKGLMSENMMEISIKLILDDKAGLHGAVKHASSRFDTHPA